MPVQHEPGSCTNWNESLLFHDSHTGQRQRLVGCITGLVERLSWRNLGTCGLQGNIATLVMVIILAFIIGVYGIFAVASRMRKRGSHMLPSSPMLARGSLQSSPCSPTPHTVELTENIDTMALSPTVQAGGQQTSAPKAPAQADTLEVSLP